MARTSIGPRTEAVAEPADVPAVDAGGLGRGYALKRLLLGRPLATARLEHERLGRPTALAVFSSDNMSSVAYATEEILRVLVPVVGVLAFSYVVPISLAIVVIEAILIFSYRQTIKAYPTAGGAYIVTKDNLGLLPAQVAGVALLLDYVLTVSVSTAAGVQAISSVFPVAVPWRIVLALCFVWLIAYANLLGVRESGRIFAVPVYVFIVSLGLTCIAGIVQVLTGGLEPPPPAGGAPESVPIGTAAVTVFLVLRAFASGGAAVTGVEAISNGVPAFHRPEWRNAQATLVWMGVVLGSTFLAVSFLAARLRVVPTEDESVSVLAMIARAVYGDSAWGHAAFLVLQIGTTLILIFAANTSFADFPRLASFQAGDAFLPRQLTKRGHRLVFSNGIVALAVAASVVTVLFRASVTAMIPLYALGVFTSFTLSQAGMAVRHVRRRERGWRFGTVVNGSGAVATCLVALVIAVVKFTGGAWIVMVAVPVLVAVLLRVHRTYAEEDRLLAVRPEDELPAPPARSVAIVLVRDLEPSTLHAVQYALTVQPDALHAVAGSDVADVLDPAWARLGTRITLERLRCATADPPCVERYVRDLVGPDARATVILPVPEDERPLARLRRAREWSALAARLGGMQGSAFVAVRDHGGPGHHLVDGRSRVLPRTRHVAIVLTERMDRAVLRAVRYARGIGASDVRAIHAANDPDRANALVRDWLDRGHIAGVPLDVEECHDRNIERSLRRYVARYRRADTEISLILPRRHVHARWHLLLHDRTSRRIARAFARDAHVDVVVVPFHLGGSGPAPTP